MKGLGILLSICSRLSLPRLPPTSSHLQRRLHTHCLGQLVVLYLQAPGRLGFSTRDQG